MTNRKKHIDGEINYSPIPLNLAETVSRTGFKISVFYENIKTDVKSQHISRRFSYYCLAHLIGGDGFYRDFDTETTVELKPGDGVMVAPGKLHQYGGKDKYFIEDSICFQGPAADALLQSGIIRNGVIHIGSERRLLPIIQKVRDPGMVSQFEANIMLQQLIIDLFRENSRNDSGTHQQLYQLFKELNAAPGKWWTVEDMAEYCNISANHLRTLFKNATGMTPKHYVDQLKMSKAAELLCSSRLKISEIADFLGYADHYHFIRRFSHLHAMPPARYRKVYTLHSATEPFEDLSPDKTVLDDCPFSS